MAFRFSWTYSISGFPVLQLVPKDDAGLETRVGYSNLGETVFLQVVE